MNNELDENLLKSIIAPELESSAKEILELGIDEITTNEVVKKIPIISLVASGYKTVVSIRDYCFMKKILHFLYEQTKISTRDREKWLAKSRNNKDAKVLGEVIIELIDKCNTVKKAKILGILFRLHIKGEVSTQEFIRIGEMIDAVYMDDLEYFLKTDEEALGEMGDEVDHLLSTGFLFRGGGAFGGNYFPNKKPKHSSYGKLIYKALKLNLP